MFPGLVASLLLLRLISEMHQGPFLQPTRHSMAPQQPSRHLWSGQTGIRPTRDAVRMCRPCSGCWRVSIRRLGSLQCRGRAAEAQENRFPLRRVPFPRCTDKGLMFPAHRSRPAPVVLAGPRRSVCLCQRPSVSRIFKVPLGRGGANGLACPVNTPNIAFSYLVGSRQSRSIGDDPDSVTEQQDVFHLAPGLSERSLRLAAPSRRC